MLRQRKTKEKNTLLTAAKRQRVKELLLAKITQLAIYALKQYK